MDFLKKNAFWVVAIILSFHFVLGLVVSSQESAIYDERAHVPAAYSYVRYGDMRLNPEHPPLLKDLAGLPLLALQPSFPLASPEWQSGVNEQWSIGDMFINCTKPELACNDSDSILFWSRIPITLVAVFLGIAIFLWTRELGGTLAGLLAVTLYAFDPNIIAHNHYVTTDIGIAAFLFFAFYFFIRFLKKPSLKNVIVAGIFLGLAELAKVSAILLFPLFGLFVVLYALTKQKPRDETRSTLSFKWHALLSYVFKFMGSVLVCFTLIWSLYAWNTIHMPGETLIGSANLYLSQKNIAAEFAHALVVNTSGNAFLKPLSEYFLGVAMIFARVESGNPHYFLGEVTMAPSPAYFPLVFVLKETLPLLLLLFLASIYAIWRIGKTVFRERYSAAFSFLARSFQNKTPQYLIFAFILLYSYVSITGKLNIGFRHLFPMLPFLYMLIAKSTFDFFKRHSKDKLTRKALAILISVVTLSVMAIPILACPNYLSYFNIAAGGHLNGYKYVTDSNYDWGQDLKRLRDWIENYNTGCLSHSKEKLVGSCSDISMGNPIDKIRVDYFGGSSPAYYLGDKFIPWWDQRDPEPGWYAISSFFYQESLYKQKPAGAKDYSWLQNVEPIDRAGDSFFIYYIPAVK